ncbi:hypothetical protein AB0C10_26965 [Microbispora amethystogenes]|uniref:hypothetical protein n=1 Tax=Microbispora amethystogenes TaxID=1427754 RepID=UPI0033F98D56
MPDPTNLAAFGILDPEPIDTSPAREPLVAQVGDQLIVFPTDWPQCVAADSGKRRCRGAVAGVEGYEGWEDYYVPELDGKVCALLTSWEDSLILQRCEKHAEKDAKTLLAPEWVYFNPADHASLVRRQYRRIIWTPAGLRKSTGHSTPVARHQPALDDKLAELLIKAAELRATPPTVTTALYRYYDAQDRLLYVGITDNLIGRTMDHVQRSSWSEFATRATIERYPTRKEADEAERAAITAERPLFNAQYQDTPETHRRLVEYLIEQGRTDLLVAKVSRG